MADLEPADIFTYDIPQETSFLDAKQIRDNFTALAQTHLTTDPTKPLDARDGMLRLNRATPTNTKLEVFLSGAWRTMLQNVELGTPSPIKQIVQVVTPTNPWVIDHNLGAQVVAQVFDAAFVGLKPVNTFDEQNVVVARNRLATGPVITGYPLAYNGVILGTFTAIETVGVGGPINSDFLINAAPVTGGTIVTPAGPAAGTIAAGSPGPVA